MTKPMATKSTKNAKMSATCFCHSERSEESSSVRTAWIAGFLAPLRTTGMGLFAFFVLFVANPSGDFRHV
jgi:hypothetical protein